MHYWLIGGQLFSEIDSEFQYFMNSYSFWSQNSLQRCFDVIQKYENRLQCSAQWRFRLIVGIEIQRDADYTICRVFHNETVGLFNQWIPNSFQQFLVVDVTDVWLQLLLKFGFLNETVRDDSVNKKIS